MPNMKNRPRPTAGLNNAQFLKFDRGIILHTGRGGVTLTPEEAEALADELKRSAEQHRERVNQKLTTEPKS